MTPTLEQQVEALWKAMQNSGGNYRFDVFDWTEQNQGVQIDIDEYDDGRYVRTVRRFAASTRTEAISELIAFQVAEKLT